MFHELIFTDEVCRAGSGGALWGLFCGLTIGLPPLLHFGRPELKQAIIPSLFTGQKKICLAISEPWAGSDVSNLRTTATKTADGKHYIVRGTGLYLIVSYKCDNCRHMLQFISCTFFGNGDHPLPRLSR